MIDNIEWRLTFAERKIKELEEKLESEMDSHARMLYTGILVGYNALEENLVELTKLAKLREKNEGN